MNTPTPKTDAFLEELYTSGLPPVVKFAKLRIYAQKLERECELCNVLRRTRSAKRAETRGLKKAWVELDDKRQILERKLAESMAYADKLADGLPVGMLPADVENLRHSNGVLADSLYQAEHKLASALSDVNLYKTYITEFKTLKKF